MLPATAARGERITDGVESLVDYTSGEHRRDVNPPVIIAYRVDPDHVRLPSQKCHWDGERGFAPGALAAHDRLAGQEGSPIRPERRLHAKVMPEMGDSQIGIGRE